LPLFDRDGSAVTAGDIRATAERIARDLRPASGPVFLHTSSVALFAAGLLAAARVGRAVACPAHLRPDYLIEIGARDAGILSDEPVTAGPSTVIELVRGAAPSVECKRDIDLLFYTSGVTGTPKLVRKPIAVLDAESAVLESLWGAAAGRVYATVSHQHIYGMLFRLFWPVLSGRISADRAAEYWPRLSGKLTRPATLVSSPAHLTRLPSADVFAGADPGLIFSSGAPLPAAAAQASADLFGSYPIEVLGSTETGGIAWRQQKTPDTAWTPLPSVRVAADGEQRLTVQSPFTGEPDPICTGDNVEFSGETFLLKGRADRIAKIEGKRVSLVRVEEALRTLPSIKDAAAVDLPSRKGALGAVVELTEDGEVLRAAKGSFRFSRDLKRVLIARLEPAERPKHWKFAPIARNAQGKVVQSALRTAFDAPAETFYGRSRVIAQDDGAAEITLDILPTMIWFEGHFPGEPVLAGLAQLHLAVSWAEQVWGWKPASANISRLKFRHVLRPGDHVVLKLVRQTGSGRLSFTYRFDGATASEGVIGGEP
jgi:3-hydroxymyristoyl/3-hydroxydecanoyl-(acyl carrier protein) dehydratase